MDRHKETDRYNQIDRHKWMDTGQSQMSIKTQKKDNKKQVVKQKWIDRQMEGQTHMDRQG